MFDLLRETLSLHNLPATVLLGMVVMYWLLVIVGVVDADMDGDVGVGEGFEIGDGHGAHGSAGAGMSDGGRVGRSGVLNFSDVPLNITGSFIAIFLWLGSMWGNYYLNGTVGNRSWVVAILLLFPNAILSILLARVAVIPFQKLFRAMRHAATETEVVVGREATVVSAQVDERYGQVEVRTNAAPLLVNARIEVGARVLIKGEQVMIVSAVEDGSYYFVRENSVTEEEKLTI